MNPYFIYRPVATHGYLARVVRGLLELHAMWRLHAIAHGLMLLHVLAGTAVCALHVLGVDVDAPDRKGRR